MSKPTATHSKYFAPPTYYEYCTEDGHHYLADPGGYVLTRDQWQELKARIDSFFWESPDKLIEEHNEEKGKPKANPVPAIPTPVKTAKKGYIYLIHGEGTPWYKIGQTQDPDQRIKALATQGPFACILKNCFAVNDMDGAESYLHRNYADKKVNGEWFVLTPQDVRDLCNLEMTGTYSICDIANELHY